MQNNGILNKVTAVAIGCILTITLTGCGSTASNYQPIVDGPTNEDYQNDLAACSQLSEQREYLNDDVKSEALLGAGIGALVGVIEDGSSGLVAGALVGGSAAGGGKAWETRTERKQIVIQCMRQRGHNVVG